MNIYNYLKKDHEKVKQLFENIIETPSKNSERERLFQELKEELLVHADAEHATFYKQLKKYDEAKDLIKHAEKEHAEVKAYLEELSQISLNAAEWLVLLGELKYAVEHHVKEEEGMIFKKAKQIFDKETEQLLVEQIEAAKEKILQSESSLKE